MSLSMPPYTQHSQPVIAVPATAPGKIGRIDPVSASRSIPNESFAERQIVHFAMVLGRKWACTEPGHEMCFTGQGKHISLTDDMIMAWVTALCNGEATTQIPPFPLSEESGSDLDTQPESYSSSGSYMDMVLSKPAVVSDSGPGSGATSSFTIATQTSRLPKTIRKYSSSSRISATSSFSQVSSASQISSVSTSSWPSAGTGSLASSGGISTSLSEGPMTPPVSPPTNVSFPYATLQHGSPVKSSTSYRIDLEPLSPSPSFSNPLHAVSPQRPTPARPPHVRSSPPLSPLALPLSTLPPPLPMSTRPRADSLNSEFAERLSMSLQQLLPPQQQTTFNPSTPPQPSPYHRQASARSVSPSYPNHPPPPRPPRHQNRPQSPEITHQDPKLLEFPETPLHTPQPARITPTRSGLSFNGLRSHPYPHPHSSPSSSTSHSHFHPSPYLHPSHSPQLTHVQEEEEQLAFDPELSGGRREREHGGLKWRPQFNDEVQDADIENDPRRPDDHYLEVHNEYELNRRGNSTVGSEGGGTKSGAASTREGVGVDGDVYANSDEGGYGESGAARGVRSIWSPYTSFLPSLVTNPGAGNDQPPSITSTVKTKWIESAALTKRAKSHLGRIKKWRKRANTVVIDGRYSKRGKEGAQVGTLERDAAIEMMGDAIETARSCYSPRIHKLGYELGKEVQSWLQTFTDNDPAVLYKKENISLLTTVQTCFLPILLMRIADTEPSAATLGNNLIVSLTKVPLSLHENEAQSTTGPPAPLFTSPPGKLNVRLRATSSDSRSLPSSTASPIPVVPHHRTTSISSIAIHIVARELGSAAPICPSQHPWLGMTLLKIVEMSMKNRPISVGEMEDIRAVARKREGEYAPHSSSYPTLIDARFTRPWEVALFALCGTAETPAASFFRRMVLGPMGIPLFIKSLDSLMSSKIDMGDVKWDDVGLTLRALAFVSEHGWVVQGMSGDGEGKGHGDRVEEIIKSIMGVFWRSIPERWFSIRFWAMDAVRNIVSHRPPLVRLLADIKADKAFITLTPTSPLYPAAINTSRMSNEGGQKVRNKMLEEYRKESAKRAEEMVDYIRMWYGVNDQNVRSTVVIRPVAIGFAGR